MTDLKHHVLRIDPDRLVNELTKGDPEWDTDLAFVHGEVRGFLDVCPHWHILEEEPRHVTRHILISRDIILEDLGTRGQFEKAKRETV